MPNPSKWKGKFKTLKEYYANAVNEKEDVPDRPQLVGQKKYPAEYYEFDKFQLTIDPDETAEDVEAYTKAQQDQETIKCAHSFAYWCQKYVKILHPMRGLVPFLLYKYQMTVIKNYEDHRFNIISKFRQGGLTTVTLIWGLWRTLFKTDQQIMLLSKTDREATDIGMIVDRVVEYLPSWMKPNKNAGKWNDHLKQITETGGALKFYSPEAARGKAVTFLIIDEAAFIDNMDSHWKAMWPVLSTGGSCTLVSTVNGLGNWYEETFHGAKEGRNKFHVIELDYWEHPDYNDKIWVEDQKAQLGERGFAQEVLRSFLGSGETYIPPHILAELDRQTRDNDPLRKAFRQWTNKATRAEDVEGVQRTDKELDQIDRMPELVKYQRGALWIWREAIDGHEYIVSADVAEGMGENGDNSCFQVIDCATLEQVAEFYSNSVPPYIFSQILNEIGLYYNTALMVVENMGAGVAVISNLENELFYENMFFDEKASQKVNKPGIKMTRTNRPVILESLQQRVLTGTLRINSRRLVRELKTLEYNPTTKRAEAQKGKHDDAIMALAMALWVRDQIMRDIPMGADVPVEVMDTFKSQTYEDIKREILEGAPKNWIEEEPDFLAGERGDILPGVIFNYKRRYDALLKEFGW